MLHTRKQNGRLITTQSRKFYPAVIPADGKIAGYLPAPKDAKADYTLMGKASDGTQVVVAECHHEDITHNALADYVHDWYTATFPEDNLGYELPFSLTFQDVVDAIPQGKVYEVLGVDDSIVRERVFEELADMLGVGYGVIYDAWIDKKPVSKARKDAGQAKLPEVKAQQKPVAKKTARKNAKPASKTLKFPFAKDLIIDGENVGKCTEIQEFASHYDFITYNGVYQCRKNDKIASTGFDIKITTTK